MQWGEENRVTFGSFFTEYEVDDRKVWECVLCKDVGDNKGNTSNLWSHLKKKTGKDGKNDSDDMNLDFRV